MHRNGIYILQELSLAMDVEPALWDGLVKRKKKENGIKNSLGKVFGIKYCLFTMDRNLVALAIHLEKNGSICSEFHFSLRRQEIQRNKREYLKMPCIIEHTLLSDEGSHDINSVDISVNFEFYGKHLWRYWSNIPSPSVSRTIRWSLPEHRNIL